MAIFRHFVAIGVGAAIALSIAESGASTELPSLKQPRRNSAENEDQEPLTAFTQELLTAAVPTKEADDLIPQPIDSEAHRHSDAIPSRDTDAQSIAENLPASEPLRSEEPNREKDNEKNSVTDPREVVFSVTALTPEIKSEGVGEWGSEKNSSDSPIYPSPYPFISVSQIDQKPKRSPAPDGKSWRTKKLVEYSQPLTESRGDNPKPQTRSQDNVRERQNPKSNDGVIVAQSPRSDGKTPVPEYLNPNPNPLLFPTESQEVQIRATQPITLQQAIELAERNNRSLQEAQLALERDQAAAREARRPGASSPAGRRSVRRPWSCPPPLVPTVGAGRCRGSA